MKWTSGGERHGHLGLIRPMDKSIIFLTLLDRFNKSRNALCILDGELVQVTNVARGFEIDLEDTLALRVPGLGDFFHVRGWDALVSVRVEERKLDILRKGLVDSIHEIEPVRTVPATVRD